MKNFNKFSPQEFAPVFNDISAVNITRIDEVWLGGLKSDYLKLGIVGRVRAQIDQLAGTQEYFVNRRGDMVFASRLAYILSGQQGEEPDPSPTCRFVSAGVTFERSGDTLHQVLEAGSAVINPNNAGEPKDPVVTLGQASRLGERAILIAGGAMNQDFIVPARETVRFMPDSVKLAA